MSNGAKVVSFTHFLQGPSAVQILADLGADVVKIEPTKGAWERLAETTARLPLGRFASPGEISPAAGYVTGEVLHIDGRLHRKVASQHAPAYGLRLSARRLRRLLARQPELAHAKSEMLTSRLFQATCLYTDMLKYRREGTC